MDSRKSARSLLRMATCAASLVISTTALAGRWWVAADGSDGYWSNTANWASGKDGTPGESVPNVAESTGTIYFCKYKNGKTVFDMLGEGPDKVQIGTQDDRFFVWSATDPTYGLDATGKEFQLCANIQGSRTPSRLQIDSGTYKFGTTRIGYDSNAVAYMKLNGGTFSASKIRVGADKAGLKATLEVNGGTFTIAEESGMGYSADATSSAEMIINKGGTVNCNYGYFYIGETGPASFTMNGGTFTMVDSTEGGLSLGRAKSGDVDVSTLVLNGGVLTTKRLRLRYTKPGSKAIFNGGTLKATSKTDDFIAESDNLVCEVGEGGFVFDTAGFDVTIAHPIVAVGAKTPLVKKGAGTLKFTGETPFTASDITVYEGSVEVNGTTYGVNAEAAIDASAGGDLGEVIIHREKLEGWLKDADYANVAKYNAYGTAQLEQPEPVIIDVNGTRKTYINLETGKTYNDTIDGVSFSFKTEDLAPRTLKILSTVDSDPVENVRDIGSWPLMGGAKMKQGVILRGGHLDHFVGSTPEQKAASYLTTFVGLNSEIELRKDGVDLPDSYKNPDSEIVTDSFAASDCEYVYCGLAWGDNAGTQIGADDNGNFTNMIHRVFSTWGTEGKLPSYFHCRIGTDRTGIVGLLLLAMMGVEEEVLYRDYLMSNFANIEGSRNTNVPDTFIRYLLRGDCNGGKYVYNTKDGEYGASIASRARQYLEMCGVTEEELDVITTALSDETADEVLARVKAYEQANGYRTVSYVTDPERGTTNSTHRLPSGVNKLPASNPTRDGYVFQGWDTENEANGIVYAIWEAASEQSKKLKWDNNGGDCLISNAENWYVSGTDPHEHGYLPRIIDEAEFSNDDARYAALNEGETFEAKSLYIGRGWNSTSPQVVDVTNGTFTVEGTVNLGQYGAAGELNVFGGTVSMKQVLVAHWGSHTYNKFNIYGGEVNITGGSWPGSVSIGNQADDTLGVMTVSGGTVNIGGGAADNTSLVVGFSNLKTPGEELCNKMLVTGGTTTVDGASIYVAHATGAGGLVQVSDGKLSASSNLVVGNARDTWARVDVSGGELAVGGDMNIGEASNSWAQVDITGGSVTVGGTTRVGNHSYARHAVLNIAGGELDAETISLARQCDGTLYITDGGVVKASQIQKDRDAPAVASPKVFIDGGTIVAKANTGLFFASVDSVMVGDGGAAFDTAGFNVTIEACRGMAGTGSFTKKGEGTLEVKADSYEIHCDWNIRGMIIVEAGTLKLPANQTIYCAGTQVADGANLDLNGSTIIEISRKVVESLWTNAAGDGNPSNPVNWRSTIMFVDKQGVEVAGLTGILDGVLPTADSEVKIPLAGTHPDMSGMTVKSVVLYGNGDSQNLRGIIQVPAVVQEAVAWYDPDDSLSVTTNSEGCVTAIKNKGTRKEAYDLVAYNGNSIPTLDAGFKIHTRQPLVHIDDVKGFVSEQPFIPSANGQTFFAIEERFSTSTFPGSTKQVFGLEVAKDGDRQYGIAQWEWWGGRISVKAVTNSVDTTFVMDDMANDADKPYIWSLVAGEQAASATCAYKGSSGSMSLRTSAGKTYDSLCLDDVERKIYYAMRHQYESGSSGLVGEAMIFDRPLTDDEVGQVRDYLYAKWYTDADMSNIPSNILLENNATLDFGGGNWTFDTVKGQGTLGTANVTITGSIEAGLTVGGEVTFAPGATIDCSSFDEVPVGTEVVFLTATKITNWPSKARSSKRVSSLRPVYNDAGEVVRLVGTLASVGFTINVR